MPQCNICWNTDPSGTLPTDLYVTVTALHVFESNSVRTDVSVRTA